MNLPLFIYIKICMVEGEGWFDGKDRHAGTFPRPAATPAALPAPHSSERFTAWRRPDLFLHYRPLDLSSHGYGDLRKASSCTVKFEIHHHSPVGPHPSQLC